MYSILIHWYQIHLMLISNLNLIQCFQSWVFLGSMLCWTCLFVCIQEIRTVILTLTLVSFLNSTHLYELWNHLNILRSLMLHSTQLSSGFYDWTSSAHLSIANIELAFHIFKQKDKMKAWFHLSGPFLTTLHFLHSPFPRRKWGQVHVHLEVKW